MVARSLEAISLQSRSHQGVSPVVSGMNPYRFANQQPHLPTAPPGSCLNDARLPRIFELRKHYWLQTVANLKKGIPLLTLAQTQFPYAFPYAKAPVNLHVELTNRCNLRCTYCTSALELRKPGAMSDEMFNHVIKAQESEYPPCISKLLKRATKGQHMSHTERFTLVTYLIHQGLSIDSIVKLFSNVSDFNEEKTRYQVEHLAGKRYGGDKPYVTYNCSTLQTHGVCSGPVNQICMRIKNPLTYHLKKQRKAPRRNRD